MSVGCFVCRSPKIGPIIDVGPQPISNRFLKSPGDTEECYPVALRQCEQCGLIQIEHPVPASALVPPYDWITYSEPEPHLDAVVDILMGLPGIREGAVAGGVSFKDDTTLARLERRGLRRWRLDLTDDLRVEHVHGGMGVETIQDRLTPERARRIAERRGRADVLIVRHILEHSSVPHCFIDALKQLTTPNGYIVFEVPDCGRAFDGCDYTTIWEEHTLYFTPPTLATSLPPAGLDVVRTENYPYPFENSLVAIAKPSVPSNHADAAAVGRERERGRRFGQSFDAIRDKVRRALDEHRARGPVAMFGAGHLAITWLSVFGVEDAIDCVIDDNPHKRGMFMPGSKLPIVGSSALLDREIRLCLLSLNPIGEQKVVEKNTAFVERGGLFASIFPASARALAL